MWFLLVIASYFMTTGTKMALLDMGRQSPSITKEPFYTAMADCALMVAFQNGQLVPKIWTKCAFFTRGIIMLAQLPYDIQLIGYKLSKPFHYVPVYRSLSADFIGSEEDFIRTGRGYYYLQVDKFTRRTIPKAN